MLSKYSAPDSMFNIPQDILKFFSINPPNVFILHHFVMFVKNNTSLCDK